MENCGLDDYMKQHNEVTVSTRIKWCTQLVSAVIHLHAQNVTHGDLVMRNLLLDSELNIKVADFELASFPGGSLGRASVGPQWTIKDFTVQEENDTKKFALVDVYCLGSVMHALLSGKVPFEGVHETGDSPRIPSRGLSRHVGAALRSANPGYLAREVTDPEDILLHIALTLPYARTLAQ